MAITPINVAEDRRAVQYTGTNAAEIAALIDDFTVTSETAAGLTFTSAGTSYTVAPNGYLTYWQGAVREQPFQTEDDFFDVYRDIATDSHVHELKLVTGPAMQAPEEPAA